MSVSSEITRIEGLRDRLKTKLKALGLLSEGSITKGDSGKGDSGKEDLDRGDVVVTGKDLSACAAAMDNISGSKAITGTAQVDVAGYQYAQVRDANLRAANIAEGVKILGITGTHSGATPNQNVVGGTYLYGQKEAPSFVYPPDGCLFGVMAPQLAANTPLVPENIKAGVQIMGVTGTLKQGYYYTKMTGITLSNHLSISLSPVPFRSISKIKEIHINMKIGHLPYECNYKDHIIHMRSTRVEPPSNIIFEGVLRSSWPFTTQCTAGMYLYENNSNQLIIRLPPAESFSFHGPDNSGIYEALIVYEEE